MRNLSSAARARLAAIILVLLAAGAVPAHDWSQLTPSTRPGPRAYHGLHYFIDRGQAILFGGSQTETNPLSPVALPFDTFAFDGTNWTSAPLGTRFPGKRSRFASAYDLERDRIVMYGGFDDAVGMLGDTWVYDGTAWTQLTGAGGPGNRGFHAMAYDIVRDRMVMFGGFDTNLNANNDTWEFNGSTWSRIATTVQPPSRARHAMAYDVKRGRVVLYGGSDLRRDTWSWNGTTWSEETGTTNRPNAQQDMSLAYDPARESLVLFGGLNGTVHQNELWEFELGQWNQDFPVTNPPGRRGAGLTYDVVKGRVLLFGGRNATSALQDTWALPSSAAGALPALTSIDFSATNITTTSLLPVFITATFSEAVLASPAPVLSFFPAPNTQGNRRTPNPVTFQPFSPGPSNVTFLAAFRPNFANNGVFGGTIRITAADDNAVADLTPQGALTIQLDRGVETSAWSLVRPDPTMLFSSAMVFDSARRKIVAFGGTKFGGGPIDETWEFDGATWKRIVTATSPPAREEHAMVYDSARSRTVLFSGRATGGTTADTWEYDGTTWTKKVTATSPGPRHSHAMAYDATRQRVVMFGGTRLGVVQTDTWEYDGTSWAQKSPAQSPPGLFDHAMVFDAANNRTMLFGGKLGQGSPEVADTFVYDGTTWQTFGTNNRPPARSRHVMAYDSKGGKVLLFSGLGANFTQLDDTWIFLGNDWFPAVVPLSPEKCVDASLAFDSARSRFVLLQATSLAAPTDRQTWFFDTNGWNEAEPVDRQATAMTYDSGRGRAVMFGGFSIGGQFLNDTWEWDGTAWHKRFTPQSPPARKFHVMAYDAARGRIVLNGGETGGGLLTDTWEYDGTTWTDRQIVGPPSRSDSAMVYDTRRRAMVLFGGAGAQGGPLADTWEFDGNQWVQRRPPGDLPGPRLGHAMAYEPGLGVTFLFGGSTSRSLDGAYSDTWVYDGSTWQQLSPANSPPPRVGHRLVYDAARGTMTLFDGIDQAGTTLSETWDFDGFDWVRRPLLLQPPPRSYYGFAYDLARGKSVLFGGQLESNGEESGDTWELGEAPVATVLAGLRFQAPDGGVVPYGLGNDTNQATEVVETTVDVFGLQAPDGARVVLQLERSGFGVTQRLFATVRAGFARFTGVLLDRNTAYGAIVLDGNNRPLGNALLTEGNLPLARIRLLGANGGPQIVTLDGRGSFSPRRLPLTYLWSDDERPPGAPALSSTSSVVRYAALVPGPYTFRLVVTESAPDGRASSATVSLFVGNGRPFASAGPDRVIILPDSSGNIPPAQTSTSVVLDGRASRDPEGQSLTYSWSILGAPPNASTAPVFFSDPSSRVTRFDVSSQTNPGPGNFAGAGEYLLQLLVTDPDGLTDTDVVRLTAIDPNNLVPSADAGLDRVIRVRVLSTSPLVLAPTVRDPTLPPTGSLVDFVRLDGRLSTDPNVPPRPLSYQWTIVSTPPNATLEPFQDPTSPTPRFTPGTSGEYRLQLVTSNGLYSSAPSEVSVFVQATTTDNTAPIADMFVADLDGRRLGDPATGLVTATAATDTLVLDGTASTDREDPAGLTYLWEQTRGDAVVLAPSTADITVSFTAPTPGVYGFRLTVTDPDGTQDRSAEQLVLAIGAGNIPPRLSLTASASGGDPGQPDPEDQTQPLPRALRAMSGTTVTLTALASDPDVPASQSLAFSFQQLAGPPVVLTTSPQTSPLQAEAQFTPTTDGLHVFEAKVRELDSSGAPTGVERSRRIRVAVDSPANRLPTAAVILPPGKDADAQPCEDFLLNGTGSDDSGNALAYRWVQVAGPPVVLSDPFSAVTTFVVPDLGDENSSSYVFQLFVEDGVSRSDPAQISIEASAANTRTVEIRVGTGINLIALPVRPGVGNGDPNISLALTEMGVPRSAAALLPSTALDPTTGFSFYKQGFGGVPDQVVRGNEGLMLFHTGGERSLALQGVSWASARRTRILRQGVNVVSYPRKFPEGETAESLRARAGASFVAGTTVESGRAKFRVHIPGLATDFPIEEGKSYLLSVPASAELTLPACSF